MALSSSRHGGGGAVIFEGTVLSLAVFAMSAYFFCRAMRTKSKTDDVNDFYSRRRKSMLELQQLDGDVSNRGQIARVPPIPYLKQLFACFSVS
jgi:hypothetical protein